MKLGGAPLPACSRTGEDLVDILMGMTHRKETQDDVAEDALPNQIREVADEVFALHCLLVLSSCTYIADGNLSSFLSHIPMLSSLGAAFIVG